MLKNPVAFNYESISKEHQQLIKEHASAITQHIRQSTASMVDIGRRMIRVKELIGGTAFKAWVGAEFQWSLTSVGHYIRSAKRFGHLECLDNFCMGSLIVLGKKHVPQAAVDQAVELARSGQKISTAFASELVDRLVLEQFSANSNTGIEISAIKVSQTAARMTERGRPTANIRTLMGSVEKIRAQMHQVYEVISEADRKSLADDLMALAHQLLDEPIIQADVESSEADTESETVVFSSKQRGRRELASV